MNLKKTRTLKQIEIDNIIWKVLIDFNNEDFPAKDMDLSRFDSYPTLIKMLEKAGVAEAQYNEYAQRKAYEEQCHQEWEQEQQSKNA
jgi:hypothetical protein